MAHEDKELVLGLDPVEWTEFEIEARRRGIALEDVAKERFVEALNEKLERVTKVFLGDPDRPSKTRKQH